MPLWDDVKTNLVSWYDTAAEKTNELAKVGSRKYDIFGLSRDIERQFSEMGSLVYNALREGRTDLEEDPVLLGLVDQVRELELRLDEKKQEIEEIRTHAAAAGTAAAAAGAGEVEAEPASAEPVRDQVPDPADEIPADEVVGEDAAAEEDEAIPGDGAAPDAEAEPRE